MSYLRTLLRSRVRSPAPPNASDERPLVPALGGTPAAEEGLGDLQIENEALKAQLASIGRENADLRALYDAARTQHGDPALQIENEALKAQLASIGRENVGLRALYDASHKQYADAAYKAGLAEVHLRAERYNASRFRFQVKALQNELFGPPAPCVVPPKSMPRELADRYLMNGKAELIETYADWTYPSNHPAIYTDLEIDAYTKMIAGNVAKPREERDWNVYGTLDEWMCEAIAAYPIRGKTVVHMGSMTPWYESMCLYFGGTSVTIDYNSILLRTNRIRVMTIEEWDRDRPRFDVGFSISSFEHDGLGAYGDPIDPDADLEAMRKMKERIVPGGLLFLAVPTGRDQVRWNMARVYGRHRLPLLMRGWEWLDSYGYADSDLNGDGSAQPLYILRNAR